MFSNRFTALVVCALFLTSCFGGPTNSDTSTVTIEDSAFTIQTFASWDNLTESLPDSPVAAQSYYVYQSPLARDAIFSKFIIVKEILSTPMNTIDYARRSIASTPTVTVDYKKDRETDIEIDAQKTLLHVYTARHSSLSPELLFLQTFIVIGGVDAYTLSYSVAPSTISNTSAINTYIDLLTSFRAQKK